MDYLREKKLRIWESALLISLCLALCAGTWAEGRMETLRCGLVRLHVLAHSDEAEEQEVKLRVRDAVLAHLAPRLESADSAAGARELIEAGLEDLARAAAGAAEGRSVRVTLSEERYPSRYYPGFALPAGRYQSLRVVLGDGGGQNWWCVVFPPLCTESVSVRAAETMGIAASGIISDTEGRSFAFRTVELWGELTAFFERLKSD